MMMLMKLLGSSAALWQLHPQTTPPPRWHHSQTMQKKATLRGHRVCSWLTPGLDVCPPAVSSPTGASVNRLTDLSGGQTGGGAPYQSSRAVVITVG